MTAGCADLLECADSNCCPIPFATLSVRPDSSADSGVSDGS
jgi:hypothetical protein